MRRAIGGAYVYNLIIVFLLVAFGFLMATVSYSKAYRVSKGVISIIENYSGYAGTDSPTQSAIEYYLTSVGYNRVSVSTDNCPERKNSSGKSKKAKWAATGICIYEMDKTTYTGSDKKTKTQYITYGVISYMSIDLPIIELIKVPIYGETEKIYVFN